MHPNITLPTIGLFGTCGKSAWRAPFVEKYTAEGIPFFNPQLPPGTWKPECAVDEARHLAEDEILLFPITSETYAVGSLAETGFSILNAIKLDDRRFFIGLIHDTLDEELMQDADRAKESLRARALVKEHLRKLRFPNIYLVETFDEMLAVSREVWECACTLKGLQAHNPHNLRRK